MMFCAESHSGLNGDLVFHFMKFRMEGCTDRTALVNYYRFKIAFLNPVPVLPEDLFCLPTHPALQSKKKSPYYFQRFG